MKIRQLMTTDVSTAEPETTLEEIATIMRNDDVGAVPVVENDELIGIITDRDLVIRCIAEGKDPSATRADDILTDEIETIEPDADVQKAAELMSRKQIRRLPVVENGRLVGMLSIGDLAVKQQDDSMSGDTLQKVSRGVKRSSKPVIGEKEKAAKTKTSPTRENEEQGITNHSAQQEEQRQSRVVSIRPEAKAAKSRRRIS